MNVLFISNDETLFSADSSARKRMAQYAAQLGNVHVVSRAPRDMSADAIVDGPLTLHPLPYGKLAAYRQIAARAREILIREHIDVVSAQDPFEYGRAALIACEGTAAKLHIQLHTDMFSPFFAVGTSRTAITNRVRLYLAERVLPRAAGIRVVSERLKRSMMEHFGSRLATVPTVIPIAVSVQYAPPVALPAHSFSFALLCPVARLEHEKGVADVLEAFAIVQERYTGVGLFITGTGSERPRLEKIIQRNNLQKSVVFLGFRNDLKALMGSAGAVVQASLYEGYGLVFLEAALSRVPLVTTLVGCIGEVLQPEEDVLASAPGDPQALASNIMRLIDDNRLRQIISRNAEVTATAYLAAHTGQAESIAEDIRRLAP